MKKNSFKHLTNASKHFCIQLLIADHGVAAYGIYWVIVEILHEEGYFDINRCEEIALTYSVKASMVRSVIFNYGLFDIDHNATVTVFALDPNYDKNTAITWEDI